MNSFKTPKGTTLPLLDLKGKAYLQVAHRLVWFREEHPDWCIKTDLKYFEPGKYAVTCATICNEKSEVIATAHKQETCEGFYDFIEKSETGAIGRALALCGYGTQFTDDLEEGERLADSPLSRAPTAAVKTNSHSPTAAVGTTSNKWDHQSAKTIKANPDKLVSPAQVGRLLKLCEVHQWDKKSASELSAAKYGKPRFSELNNAEYEWICNCIQTSNFFDCMGEIKEQAKELLRTNPPSAMFDENNPPPMTEEDIPF